MRTLFPYTTLFRSCSRWHLCQSTGLRSGTAYGAGLRVSGVAALKIGDINSTRMLIRAEQRKGRKDRNAMLSLQLLEQPSYT